MSEWNPIESAPKDGTPVLLWLSEKADRHYPADGVCDYIAIGLHQWGHWCTVEAEDCGGMGGEYTGWMPDWQLIRVKPSHWMPLPDPPK